MAPIQATSSNAPGPIALGKVSLDVGGRKFLTLACTLDRSDLLRALVSERWKHNRQADGSYFVDANPDTFEDILDYLRTGIMSLFWNAATGYNHHRCQKLQQEAAYLGTRGLEEWPRKVKYLQAVQVFKQATIRRGINNKSSYMPVHPSSSHHHLTTEWVDYPASPQRAKMRATLTEDMVCFDLDVCKPGQVQE